jgi:hypothetical protein
MTRTPLFTTLARAPSKALRCRCCGFRELVLLLAVALWSFALVVVPKRLAQSQGTANAWNEVGKPRVLVQPEVELAADCAARRGGPVLVVEALTSDEWTELSAEDFESRFVRTSKPVVVRDALAGTDAMGMWVGKGLFDSTRATRILPAPPPQETARLYYNTSEVLTVLCAPLDVGQRRTPLDKLRQVERGRQGRRRRRK